MNLTKNVKAKRHNSRLCRQGDHCGLCGVALKIRLERDGETKARGGVAMDANASAIPPLALLPGLEPGTCRLGGDRSYPTELQQRDSSGKMTGCIPMRSLSPFYYITNSSGKQGVLRRKCTAVYTEGKIGSFQLVNAANAVSKIRKPKLNAENWAR